jgi:parvulin-like peptidyl-prolyl isomerase
MSSRTTDLKERLGVPRGSWSLALFTALLLISTRAGAADESAEYQRQFEQRSQTISDLDGHAQSVKTTREIELMRTWLGQGQALFANEKYKKIDPLLTRIDALAEYVAARHTRLDADEAAQRAEEKAQESKRRAEAAKQAADAAAAKKKQLEKRGL